MTTYRELAPPASLAQWVACGWVSTRAGGHVLPDGCVDVVWTGARLIVAGPATRSSVSSDAPSEPKVGVRFRVGAAAAALGLPASELLDSNPLAGDVVRDGPEWASRVADAAGSPSRMLVELTSAVARRLREAPPVDPLVRAAARSLARPDARVRDVAFDLGLSERQLRRRFETAVGYSPKTLARVLRLQRFLVLAEADASASGGLSRLAFDAGYADQAHLTRECRELAGVSPAALVERRSSAASERELLAAA